MRKERSERKGGSVGGGRGGGVGVDLLLDDRIEDGGIAFDHPLPDFAAQLVSVANNQRNENGDEEQADSEAECGQAAGGGWAHANQRKARTCCLVKSLQAAR